MAKELKLDSKVLVDICTDAGVTGKGSALASLTDEEVDRVRAFISGGAAAKAAARQTPGRCHGHRHRHRGRSSRRAGGRAA